MKYVLRTVLALAAIAGLVAGAIVLLNHACEAYSNLLFQNEAAEYTCAEQEEEPCYWAV